MKKLFLLLLIASAGCHAQQMESTPEIPPFWIGSWTNISGTDTIIITDQTITWVSNDNNPSVSYVNVLLHNDANEFTFKSYPNVYVLSLEKVSRNKIIFDAQTTEGLSLRNDIYFKTGTRQ